MKTIQIKSSHQTAVILVITAVSITQANIVRGVLAGLGVLLFVVAYQNDWFDWLGQRVVTGLKRLTAFVHELITGMRDRGVVYLEPFDLLLGNEVETGKPIISNLEEVDTLLIVGLRGMGKTSLVHSLIHWLIKYHSPADLQLAIFDLKDGLDFRLYGRLPHLTNRIAVTLDDAERLLISLRNEQDKRANYFKAIPQDRLCNNLAAYHRVKNELKLDLPDLPIIVVVIDEIHNLVDSETAVKAASKLIKEGRAYGIKVYAATQQQKADMLPTKISSQFATKAALFLTDTGQYSRLGIVKEVWEKLTKVKGRFVLNLDGDGILVQANYVPEKQLEDLARKLSKGQPDPDPLPELEKVTTETAVLYRGTKAQKKAIVMRWLMSLDDRPNKTDFAEYFNVSEKTFYNIGVLKMWDELNNK